MIFGADMTSRTSKNRQRDRISPHIDYIAAVNLTTGRHKI
jgi:hypothetical protein